MVTTTLPDTTLLYTPPLPSQQAGRITPYTTKSMDKVSLPPGMGQYDQLLLLGSNVVSLPEATIPLTRIANQLMAKNGFHQQFRVFVVDKKRWNAGALPSGMIMIHLETLEKAKSPDELAFLMAHELSHVVHKDAKINLRNYLLATFLPASLLLPLILLLRFSKGKEWTKQFKAKIRSILTKNDGKLNKSRWLFLSAGIGIILGLPLTGWYTYKSRQMETRADSHAIQMLYQADYPINNYQDFLTGLDNAYNALLWITKISCKIFGSTHPPTKKRALIIQHVMTMLPHQINSQPFMSSIEWQQLKQSAHLKRIERNQEKQRKLL